MNRKITFRAWCYLSKAMLGPDVVEEYSLDELRGFEMDLMEYTGVKDKDGKDIFEGDILEWEENAAAGPIALGLQMVYVDKYIKKRSEVIFADGAFCLKEGRTSCLVGRKGDLAFCAKDSVVVGNVFENPELLPEIS